MSETADSFHHLPDTDPVELKIKRSRFIARGYHVHDKNTINVRLETLRAEEYKANHHCWAAVLDSGEEYQQDDGEPAGTAGRPILQVINGNRLADTLVVVTRYFGGIKLGTGGLARAYSQAVRRLVELNPPVEEIRMTSLLLEFDYDHTGTVHHFLKKFEADPVNSWCEGQMRMEVVLRQGNRKPLEESLREMLPGRIRITGNPS